MKNKSLLAAVGFALLVVIVYIFVFLAPTQNADDSPGQDDKLQVVTSFYPLYFFTSEIAGDYTDVYNITPAGAEPHDYEPTTQDIARVEDSKLVILNGGDIEPWAKDLKEILKNTNTTIVATGADLMSLTEVEDGETIKDPHVWLDPRLAKKQVEAIVRSLVKADTANASVYEQNATALINKLDTLDAEFKQQLNSCKKKDIITSHAAFGYLASAYGFNQVSVTGISPDEEPSAKQLVEVAEFAKKNNVKYIFFESLVSPKFSETIAKEVGAQTLVLNPLEGLTDKEVADGKNYFTEMRNNLTNLKIALECR